MNTRNLHTKKLGLLLLIFIFTTGFNGPKLVQAHDYYKIKLNIHVVDPASMNDTTIKNNVDKMNDIFKSCRIKFNVIKTDRTIEGNADNFASRTALRNKMKLDLRGDPFKGSGAGITITPSVDANANTNGMTIKGDPSSGIVKDGSAGETWAHEMAHGMGLGHGGKDTDGDGKKDEWDPDGDGTTDTAADKGNTMWPIRSQRTDNMFSAKNCEKLNEMAKKIGQGVLNAEQTAAAADGDSYLGKLFDYVVDQVKESPIGKLADLILGTVSAIEPFVNLTMTYVLNDVLSPTQMVDLTFQMGFDADNNSSTGTIWANVTGIDKVIEIWLYGGTFYDSIIYVNLYDQVDFENSREIFNGIVKRGLMNESTPEFENPITINDTAVYSFVQLTINMTELGIILPSVPAVFIVTDWSGSTPVVDSANFTLHTKPIDTARIKVDSMKVWENYDLSVEGENFTANTPVTLNFNDVDLKTVTTDSNGAFITSFTIPATDLGTYYLEAVDSDGNLAIMILDIVEDPNPSTTTQTTITSTTSTTATSSTAVTSPTTTSSQEEDSTDAGIRFSIIGFLTAFVTTIILTQKFRRKH
ncbi:MAG: hypothetical protein HeimC2_24930 [Candidatus Heimdallarchaeota archaeon LC_2]|nr:MAG: hypothetical protein HeimC2_24930 [Candidatus Heimdallarchaeota archaeon LC_2]